MVQELTRLQALNLFNCEVTDDTLEAIATYCPKMEYLNVAHAKITGYGLSMLSSFCNRMIVLNIDYCHSLSFLAIKQVFEEFKSLQVLLFINCKGITPDNAYALRDLRQDLLDSSSGITSKIGMFL